MYTSNYIIWLSTLYFFSCTTPSKQFQRNLIPRYKFSAQKVAKCVQAGVNGRRAVPICCKFGLESVILCSAVSLPPPPLSHPVDLDAKVLAGNFYKIDLTKILKAFTDRQLHAQEMCIHVHVLDRFFISFRFINIIIIINTVISFL